MPTTRNEAGLPCGECDLLHNGLLLHPQIRNVVQGSLCAFFSLVYLTLHPFQCFSSESGNPDISENFSLLFLPTCSFSLHISRNKLLCLTSPIDWGKEWTEGGIFMFSDILNGKKKKFRMSLLPQLILTLILLSGSNILFFFFF